MSQSLPHPTALEERGAEPPFGANVPDSWLAAYALGLAYARADAEDFVPALAQLARNDAELLAAAGVRLVRSPGCDDPALARAQRLLGAAVREAQTSRTLA